MAKGYFFKFANNYYYKNSDEDFSKISDANLFDALKEFLLNEDFTYKSQAEVEIDNLLKGAEGESKISKDLLEIKNELKGLFNKELEIYKPEILREIKAELAARYLGTDGRVLEQLNTDEQVQSALEILNDQKVYYHLLNVN